MIRQNSQRYFRSLILFHLNCTWTALSNIICQKDTKFMMCAQSKLPVNGMCVHDLSRAASQGYIGHVNAIRMDFNIKFK